MSIRLHGRICTAQRTKETASEWQTQTTPNPSDRDGDTEMRQLRSGSHHYWGKQNHKHARGLFQPTPPPAIKADPSIGTWDTSGSAALHLASGEARGLQGLRNPLPTTFSHEGGVSVPRRPVHRIPPRHSLPLSREYKDFFFSQQRSGRLG